MLTRIRWRDPESADVVVFDRTGSEMLAQSVLEGIPHAILECRGEAIYLGPRVLRGVIGALRHVDWRWLRSSPRGMLRALLGEMFKVYLLACLRAMRPRAVLTFVDNSWHFGWLSRHAPGPVYYAVQNGVRNWDNLVGLALPAPHFGQFMDFPVLFCFGDQEAELYRKLGQRVDRFVPVGSVRADWYKTRVAPKAAERRFDLCLVSQWDPDLLSGGPICPDIQQSLRVLDSYLARYVKETGASLCIALRTNEPGERKYFESVYGARAAIGPKDAAAMSSYLAVEQSEVALAMDSTILREAYAWGRKTLFCNYSGREENHTSTVADLCYLGETGYERFRDRLATLLAMDPAHYRSETEASARHLMRFDPERPSYRVIREAVRAALDEPLQGSVMA